ncbi:Glycosyl hydrolase family 67 (modular protein) [Candidatus Sulfopaludibacter sp. SbA6]|nr:Glycosyl hydrolase family 67 (modular protein) [Candidatus Sulfopaludibacter sp. SbA6]
MYKALVLCALAVSCLAANLKLVDKGRSNYAIVIAPDASPSERHGAEELQKFLEEMSGARLPITAERQPRMVLVGDSPALKELRLKIPYTDLGPEGFVLKTAGQHVVIAGGRLRGSMYGVYTFLEKLGCRWLTPEVSRIPKARTLVLGPLDEMQKPAFEYREPFFSEALDRDWAARNKTNGSFQRLDASVGGKVQYFPFVHSFDQLVPPSRYFKDHPEYFSLIDGQRRERGGQLCLTNPDVLRIGIETVERWIDAHPEATIISVSQNDRYGWCECDRCRRVEEEEGGAHSGPLLRFVNALAAEIEKKHPDKLIDTLAYQYTEDPPAKVRPRPNVRVRLCPIAACEAHPYGQCPYDAYFVKNLRAWSKITDRLYVWHYNTNFAHYLLPFPDFDELIADIPMYKQHGVVGLFMEGGVTQGGGAENAELRSYVMAKLLWDVKADANKLIDEFLDGYYGKAAKPMRAYFDLMQRQVRMAPDGMGKHIWIYDRPSAPYLSDEFLANARELFRQAGAAAESDAVRTRVRKARLGIEYVALTRAKKFTVEGGWYRPADLDGLKDRWNTFLSGLRQLGITNISESTTAARDDQDFGKYVRPYRVVTLENSRLRLHVVPELGGRITHIIDLRSGKNVLQEPEPGAKQYPDLGGLAVTPYEDYVTRMPGSTTWELDAGESPNEASLTGTCENGLRIKRRLRLDGAVLHTETILENTTHAALPVALQSRWDVDPGGLETVVVRYRKQDGGTVERALIEPERIPAGSESYNGGDQPDGEWRVVNRRGGLVMVNRFPKEQVGRCSLTWTAKSENRVGLTVWSVSRVLQPGEQVKLAADYGTE